MMEEFYVLLHKILHKNPEHIVITGDLSDNAQEKDFEIIRLILDDLKLLDPKKTSVIIGNHDIYGGFYKVEDVFTFPEKCRNTDYHDAVYNFNNHFAELFEDCIYKSENNSYPYAKILGDTRLIGLNSIAPYSKVRNPFASNGIISSVQIQETAQILEQFGDSCKHRILLVHHHFNKIRSDSGMLMKTIWNNIEKQTMKLRNKKSLINFFLEYKIDLVLHGHLHLQQEYFRKGVRFLNSGASIKNDNHSLNYNLIDFNESGITTSQHSISFKPSKFQSDRHIVAYRQLADSKSFRTAV